MKRLFFPAMLVFIFFCSWNLAQAQTDTVYVKILPPAIQSQRFHIGIHALWPSLGMPDQKGKTGFSANLRFTPSLCMLPFNKFVVGFSMYPSSYNTFRAKLNLPDSTFSAYDSGEGDESFYLWGIFARYYLLDKAENVFVELSGFRNSKSRNFMDADSSFRSHVFERQNRFSVGAGLSWFSDGLAFETGLFFSALNRYSLGWSDSHTGFASRRKTSWSLEPRVGLVYYF